MTPLRFKTAGYSSEDLLTCDYLESRCGDIEDGIGLKHDDDDGGWVLAFKDLERLYFAAKKARDNMNVCPENIKESIMAYIQGRPPGSFLLAVFANDLQGAVACADGENHKALAAILAYVYWEVPAQMWGSPEAVARHLRSCLKAKK